MNIVSLRINDLKPAEYNPRRITEKQFQDLQKSFENLGTLEPAVINQYPGRENVIISGHQRVKVAKKLGMKEYPCLEVSFPLEKEREANIRMNKNGGDFDFDMLGNEFEIKDLMDWGFEAGELGVDIDINGTEGLTDPDAVPESPKEPKTKPGDMYILGQHRLLCGDSTSIDAVQKLMGGGMANCLWTDPPYGVKYVGKTKDALEIENDDLDDSGLEEFLRAAFGCALTVCIPGASWYIAAPAGPLNHCFSTVLKEFGVWRQTLNWIKSQFVLGRSDYHYQHEPIFYGWMPGQAHSWYSDRKQTTTLNFDKPHRNGDHPTMKPVELVEYCLSNSTKIGDTILDLFGGSGTTLIASEKLGRQARLIELDPRYCDVIVRRWEEFTGKKSELAPVEAIENGR